MSIDRLRYDGVDLAYLGAQTTLPTTVEAAPSNSPGNIRFLRSWNGTDRFVLGHSVESSCADDYCDYDF